MIGTQLPLFDNSPVDVMIYPDGRDKPSFRCSCGCNVFRKKFKLELKPSQSYYVCNACGDGYLGEDK